MKNSDTYVFDAAELAFSPNDSTVHICKRAGNTWDKGVVLSEVRTMNRKINHNQMCLI